MENDEAERLRFKVPWILSIWLSVCEDEEVLELVPDNNM